MNTERSIRKGKIGREIKAMLFADVKNFSKLSEESAPTFFTKLLGELAEVIKQSARPPITQNTWGDALYLVFDDVIDCADLALRLLDKIQQVNAQDLGLPQELNFRMGLHAGPVYRSFDPIIGKENYFGSHVNLAARIEPAAAPGSAFTSEQFAAVLAVKTGHDFICEYVGIESLPKGAGDLQLYRLLRKGPSGLI
jgi:class 3 adenylate cyclase